MTTSDIPEPTGDATVAAADPAAAPPAESSSPTAPPAEPPQVSQPIPAEATPQFDAESATAPAAVTEPPVEPTPPVDQPAAEVAPTPAEEPATEAATAAEAPAAEAPAAETPAAEAPAAEAPAAEPVAEAPAAEAPAAETPAAETPAAKAAPVGEIDPDAGLGLPEDAVVLGPPNMGGFDSGQIVTGTVLVVTRREAEVDLGDGKVGVVGDRHWASGEQVDMTSVVKTGDTIEAAVLARADIKKRITLSRLWAQQKRGWEAAEAAAKDKSDLTATVTETVKGGLSLDVNGLRAFMPASLVDVETVSDLSSFVGQTFPVRVIEADRNKARLIVSRKAALRASQRQEAKEALGGFAPGATLVGTVAQITDFGAFVDVEGVRGLVHKSEIGWGRGRDPQRSLKVGQQVEVKVLKVQPSRNRLGLTMRTSDDPLSAIRKGDRFEGTVIRLVDFGAFVSSASGVEGMVHVSEMAEYRVFTPEEIVVPGDKVWVKVLKVDKKRRTLDLSMAQAVVPDPPSEVARREAEAARLASATENAATDQTVGDDHAEDDHAEDAVADDNHAEDAAGAERAVSTTDGDEEE